ncbi:MULTISPECIES: phosphotransferase [Halanaerobium]|uniref:phosphotransferase n=1 Tax=Halanaerobium TaxID=2330 RepID=UPI000DE766D6|nr:MULTISPECIES: phosphotransferase [Halanaerobium]PUU86676.1 MAG: 5-methylthioribose kinase [Halanaerobium sp.]TDP06523.1 5-methylthioribose kinase [Halanaerobium congolense]
MDLTEMITLEEAAEYIKKETNVFTNSENIIIKSLNSNTLSVNGYANNLFLIKNKINNKKVVLKQVLPYVRKAAIENVNIPLPKDRIYSEFYSLKFWRGCCSGFVPEVYYFDSNNNIIIFEYIEGMDLLRSALIKRKKLKNIDNQIAIFLARTAFYSSKYFLDEEQFNGLSNFFDQSETINIWDDLIFNRAILEPDNRAVNPLIKEKVSTFCQDKKIISKTKEIRSVFNNTKSALIHGDFHSSNIFVKNNKVTIFDTEFAGYGLPSFDMGRLIANLILNYSSLLGFEYNPKRKGYQIYILKFIKRVYNIFKFKLIRLFKMEVNSSSVKIEKYFNEYLYQMLSFISLTIISRLYDEGLCLDLKRIKKLKQRAIAQEFAVRISVTSSILCK